MNVNFFLKDKKKSITAINCIIRYRGERYKLATGVSVDTVMWDGNRADEKKGGTDATLVNIQLDRFEMNVKSAFEPYRLKGTFPDIEVLKKAVQNDRKEQKSEAPAGDFLSYYKSYYTNHSEYTDLTKDKYQTACNWIEKYEQQRINRKLKFDDINVEFYKDFRHWFFLQRYVKRKGDEPRKYSKNYFGSIIKCIKRVMDEAGPENDKLHNNTEYKHRKFKVEQEPSDSIALSIDELMTLHNFTATAENVKPICEDPREENRQRKAEAINLVKNKWLIGAFTALRVSDFNRLKEVNIKARTIRIKPKKGNRKNKDVVIPMARVVRDIIDSGFDISVKLSDQKINEHIKELCQLVGFDEPVLITRTEGNRIVERIYKKYELVTTHTCRRSGATNMVRAKIDPLKVMLITGHETWGNFWKYLKIAPEENAEELARHPFFQ